MTIYNATLELAHAVDSEDDTDKLMEALAPFHVAVARAQNGHGEVIITLQAETLRQAVATALAVVEAEGEPVVGLEVITTAEFDRRLDLAPMPELLSVSEVAAKLRTSRQAVLQRINSGSLPAARIGTTWAVPSSAVPSAGAV